jgi:tetratricopeptide (TPR) repeat protein
VPPSQHQPHVPPALDEVAIRALDPDPAKRYQSAADFKKAIDDVIWQSRCGAAEIAAYMQSMFGDRIQQRRTLLSQASRDSLDHADFENIASFRDDSSHAVSAAPITGTKAPSLTPKRRLGIVLGLGVFVGTLAAVLVYATSDKSAPSPPAPAATPAPIVAMHAEPDPAKPAAVAPEPVPVAPEPVAVPAPVPVDAAAPEPVRRPPPAKPVAAKPPAGPGPDELYKKGSDLFLAGNFAAAEASFKQALARNRGFAPAHRGLGFVYQRTGETAKALASYRTYLRLAPRAADAAAIKKRIEQLGGA